MKALKNLIGVQLGPYEVQALLGSGGMASVYRGLDHNLQRPVAIKVLAEDVARQPGFVERFRQEAQLVARLHHPHIVHVYYFGQQDGLTYMVQELLPGPTLQQHLYKLASRGMLLARQDIISITMQLASALDAAHAAGIIHRDIKPSNALWNTPGALVLTDFGIARHVLSEPCQSRRSSIIGTPHYLAPEQARGFAGTRSSDVYSLGVVVYEMITGRVPFTGTTSIDVIRQHIQMLPPPLHTLRHDVLPDVEEVVQRALSKDPAERFESAGELAYELRRAWPPLYERASQVLVETHERDANIWAVAAAGVAGNGLHTYPTPVNIHEQTTVISDKDVLDILLHGNHKRDLDKPRHAATTRRPARRVRAQRGKQSRIWGTLSLVVGTLLVLFVFGSILVAVQDDYAELSQQGASDELVIPTPVATARIAPPTALPTATPPPTSTPDPTLVAIQHARETAMAAAATSTVEPTPTEEAPTAEPTTELLVPTVPGATTTPTSILAEYTPPTTLNEQFAQLRLSIEAASTEGWAHLDQSAWLERLDAIQREVEAGNTRRAADWLQEMRQVVVLHANDGRLAPEVAQRVVANIDGIALNTGMALPPVSLNASEDS